LGRLSAKKDVAKFATENYSLHSETEKVPELSAD
jgi:hypothetical protein